MNIRPRVNFNDPMKLRIRLLLLALGVTVATALMFGCAGPRVRDDVLLPSVERIWLRVYPDLERGVKDAMDAGDLGAAGAEALLVEALELTGALSSGDRNRVALVNWAALEPYCVRGVQARVAAGELSQANATPLLQRIVNLRASIDQLSRRLSLYDGVRGRTPTTRYTNSWTVVGGHVIIGSLGPKREPLYQHNEPRRLLGLPPIMTPSEFAELDVLDQLVLTNGEPSSSIDELMRLTEPPANGYRYRPYR